MATKKSGATIRVKQIKSVIGYNRKQREVLRGMGIRRMNHTVELPDNAATRGMIAKIPHLVAVVEPGE
jgi:large subunit ribosomal protein L30